ncbi:hypothetical protein XENTR_v10021470 [Xenopus tropicalis]|nr:hypothetical protein XENTR_v10021470 [Xenopus tropicalis]
MAYVPAPGYQPAYNPPIPYTSAIAGGLRPGMAVVIQAVPPSSCNRFAINFSTGQYDGSDVAFHINPRYDGRDRVVFNSLQGGTWEKEEMKREMPFKLGKVFLLIFEITPNNYQVTVNGSPFYEFAHRIPLERVSWIQVTGEITVQALCIIGNGPASGAGGTKGAGLLMSSSQEFLPPMLGPPNLHPITPFKANIRGGMIPKRTVVIKGIVNSNAKTFQISFKVGYTNDIALHINPRLNKNTLVRNSFINGTWGEEEKDVVKNPFHQDLCT